MSENNFVLVLEDDSFYANIYKTKLKKENIDAEVAFNGDAALKIIEKRKPALILSDLIMPGMDGFETLKKLKTNPATKDIKVIVLSNLSQEEDVRRAKELGAAEYLVKANVSIQEIVEKIKENLAGK